MALRAFAKMPIEDIGAPGGGAPGSAPFLFSPAPAELEKLKQTLGELEVRPDHTELVLRPLGDR